MLKKLQNRLNESKGFTLVELIVVIAIMVILIALLVPNVVGYISSSQTTANLSAAKSIYNAANTAVVNGKASTGAFPTQDKLILLMNGDRDAANDGLGEKLVVVPQGTSARIIYEETAGNVAAVIVSTGSVAPAKTDGAVGTTTKTAGCENIAMYDPQVSGNAAEHTYTSGAGALTDPTSLTSSKDITCANGAAWQAAS